MTAVAECTAEDQHDSAPGQFSQLLLELSVRFVHLRTDQVDGEIEEALRRVCEFLGVQSASLWQGSLQTTEKWRLTHMYQHPAYTTLLQKPDGEISPRGGWTFLQPEVSPYHGVVELSEYFPWVTQQLAGDQPLVINSIDELPAEAAMDRTTFIQFGMKSVLVFPLGAAPRVFGITSFHMIGQACVWAKDVVDNLRLIAQCFAYALTRKSTTKPCARARPA